MDAIELEFIIRDEEGHKLVHRRVLFPYLIDAVHIDAEIAKIFLRIAEEKEDATPSNGYRKDGTR